MGGGGGLGLLAGSLDPTQPGGWGALRLEVPPHNPQPRDTKGVGQGAILGEAPNANVPCTSVEWTAANNDETGLGGWGSWFSGIFPGEQTSNQNTDWMDLSLFKSPSATTSLHTPNGVVNPPTRGGPMLKSAQIQNKMAAKGDNGVRCTPDQASHTALLPFPSPERGSRCR